MSRETRRGRDIDLSVKRTPAFLLPREQPRPSMFTLRLPLLADAPRGARVIDSQGAYAVALADQNGRYLGLFDAGIRT